jgi:tRNA nucleotidyltransferase (CCA-adding enzyme)
VLFPAWTSAKVNEPELERLRDMIGQLESMGIFPDPSAAYFPLLTAKLGAKEVAALKASFARPGFAEEIDGLDAATKAFAAQLSAKTAASPSDAWKLLFSAAPESVLWLAHTTKSAPLQAKFKAFFGEWSQAKQKIPYQLMQEMRITPALPGYDDLIETLFYAVMDGKLDTPEATKAFLEPYSPPAPPVPVTLRRRPAKREPKAPKSRSKKANIEASESAEGDSAVMPMEQLTPEATVPLAEKKPVSPVKVAAKSAPAVSAAKSARVASAAKAAPAAAPTGKAKNSSPKKTASKQPANPVAAKKAAPAKPLPKAKSSAPAKKVASKTTAKPAAATKKPAKPVKATAKTAAKSAPQKTAAKKAVPPQKVAAKAPQRKPVSKGAKNVPVKKAPAKAKVMPKAVAASKKKPVKVASKAAKKSATKAKR